MEILFPFVNKCVQRHISISFFVKIDFKQHWIFTQLCFLILDILFAFRFLNMCFILLILQLSLLCACGSQCCILPPRSCWSSGWLTGFKFGPLNNIVQILSLLSPWKPPFNSLFLWIPFYNSSCIYVIEYDMSFS